MIATVLIVNGAIIAAGLAIAVTQFTRDMRKAGGLRELHAELTGIVFVPAQPKPVMEIPGQRGWTRKQWADPSYGIDPVTGGPRYDGPSPASYGRQA